MIVMGDGVSDTVYIDTLSYLNEKTNESRIICKLSTKQFQPIMSSYIYYDPENFDSWYLSIAQNNFLYSSAGMRQGEDYSFSYEKDTRRIRLTQAYYYAHISRGF